MLKLKLPLIKCFTLTNAHVLGILDSKTFVVETDASTHGIGAVRM